MLEAGGMRPFPPGFTSTAVTRDGSSTAAATFEHSSCSIPKILHQTWKTKEIPFSLSKYVRSWIDVGGAASPRPSPRASPRSSSNKQWDYFFWTDQLNRHLIATRFPQWLALWDDLPESIMRADMVRYFIFYIPFIHNNNDTTST